MHALEAGGLALAALLLVGCASEDETIFGEPSRVAGGFGDRAGGPTEDCEPNPACGVSWVRDVYQGIFNAPLGGETPSGACGATTCHDSGVGGLFFPPDDSDEAYFRLTAYELVGGRRYIVGCEPGLSHMMCNLTFAANVDNPYVGPELEFTGGCGAPMPKDTTVVTTEPFTQAQFDVLAAWLACGAPQN
jgi:hypothetical protein